MVNGTSHPARGIPEVGEDLATVGAEHGDASLGDLFRQIGHDERVHKLEILARMEEPRFR